MKKLIFLFIMAISLSSCTPVIVSDQTSSNISSLQSSSEPSATISEICSDMVVGEKTKDDFIRKFETEVKKKNSIFQDEYPYYIKDKACLEFVDINNDNLPELLFSVTIYKTNSIFIFTLREDDVEMYDECMLDTSNYLDIYRSLDKVLLSSVYKYYSGIKVADVNTQFSTIDNLEIKHIKSLNFVENIETGEIQYYNSNSNATEISKEQYDKLKQSIIGEDFTKETVYLDNYVVDYMQGDNLYNALYKAYQEYQERTK